LPASEASATFLAGRALLAVLLMVAFYGLALAMIALLLGVILLEIRLGRFNLQISVFVLVGAFLILKAIVPRPDHFEPPGAPLAPADQPRLFQEIREIASATGQAMPRDVYLLLDVNAWVSQRGGLMGIGSRRVMGVGLPLLQALDVSQFRGVIAHEFGHFHGGDVRIGPWIYKTRAALVRTLADLSQHSGFLTLPFHWYAMLFFRVTHAVSRHQELLADALAARIAGPTALGSGLRATHAAGLVFPLYMHANVHPVVTAGYVPPLAEGFARVLDAPAVAQQIERALDEEYREGKPDPYDTHPPLRERLAALGAPPTGPALAAGLRGVSLLDRLPELEGDLASWWTKRASSLEDNGTSLNLAPRVAALAPVPWEEVGMRVVLPAWRRYVERARDRLAGITPSSLPTVDWRAFGVKLSGATGDEALEVADTMIGVAVGLALVGAGYLIDSQPGSSQALVRGGERVEVFSLRERVTRSPEEEEAWRAFCERAGIASTDLGTVARGD
jgi:Zn-dependent protease with chaperone function